MRLAKKRRLSPWMETDLRTGTNCQLGSVLSVGRRVVSIPTVANPWFAFLANVITVAVFEELHAKTAVSVAERVSATTEGAAASNKAGREDIHVFTYYFVVTN
jgi:hypothetical protein